MSEEKIKVICDVTHKNLCLKIGRGSKKIFRKISFNI